MKTKNPYRESGYRPITAVKKPAENRKSGVTRAEKDLRVK